LIFRLEHHFFVFELLENLLLALLYVEELEDIYTRAFGVIAILEVVSDLSMKENFREGVVT